MRIIKILSLVKRAEKDTWVSDLKLEVLLWILLIIHMEVEKVERQVVDTLLLLGENQQKVKKLEQIKKQASLFLKGERNNV